MISAADVEAMAAEFDAPTSELMPSSNAGVAELVQARLKVSSPGDSFETEAESTADQFLRAAHAGNVATSSGGGVSRFAGPDGLVDNGGGLETTDEAATNIQAARGGGVQMRPDVRTRFETFFGADLSGVRVHHDDTSDQLCRSISAEAFTSGRDVFFSRGGYAPGNATGDHLLAHELTHVVQQGHAGGVSRKATPKVMREEPRLTKKTERDPKAGMSANLAGGVATASEFGAGVAGGFGDLKEVDGLMKVDPGGASETLGIGGVDATAAVQAGGGLGLFESVANLFNSTYSLMSKWNSHSFDSAMNEGVNLVKSSMSTAQNSIQIAAASGAAIGAAVIPGLGLAIATIDLVKQVLRAIDVYKAKSNATKKLDELNAKQPLTLEDTKLKTALTRLRSDANIEMVRTVTRIVGDIVIMGGQIGTLAGGAGAPAVVAGALINGAATLSSKVQGWMEAGSLRDARAAQQADPDNALLQIERLKVDTYYSACELIKHAAVAVDAKSKKTDPTTLNLVKPFGIDEAWLERYRGAGAGSESMLDMGAKIICEKLGKDPSPSTFSEDLMKVVNVLKTGLKWVATGVGYILKFTGRVLGFVTGQVVGLLGVGAAILQMPSLGERLIEYIEPVTMGIINGTDAAVDAVGDGWNSAAARIDAHATGKEPYFTSEDDVRERSVNKFSPIVRTYFAEKKDRGTDVKADSLTSKIKDEYTNLSKLAKNTSPEGKPGFNKESKALDIIDSVIRDIIKACKPERVNLETVHVSRGKVTWSYEGDQKKKTKGFFAGVRNLFGGDYEKV